MDAPNQRDLGPDQEIPDLLMLANRAQLKDRESENRAIAAALKQAQL